MKKLYHYIHCPFCVRVRLTLGFLKIDHESIVLSYDDEKKPIELMGKKILPIFDFDNGIILNESLDIIKKLDRENKLSLSLLEDKNVLEQIETTLNILGGPIHNLCMPYWAYTQEFDLASRKYFIDKKSVKRGPFNKLMKNKDQYLLELSPVLEQLEKNLTPFYKNDHFTILDIMICSHIWGMYIFPEFQFSPKIHKYLQDIKSICSFDYHGDYYK